MLNVITTPSSLSTLRELAHGELDENSMVFILYEEEETCKASDVAFVHDTDAQLVFVPVSARDDKLLCVGGIQARIDCRIMDDELAVSNASMDKINSVFAGMHGVKGLNFVSAMTNRAVSTGSKPVSGMSTMREVMDSVKQTSPVTEKTVKTDSEKSSVIEMESPVVSEFYTLIPIQAMEYGYTYGTEAFIGEILTHMQESVDEARNFVSRFPGGPGLWTKIQAHLPKVKELAEKYEA